MHFWNKKRVVVTGGAGFLGSFVVEKLHARGCRQIFVPRRKDYDLTQFAAVRRVYREAKPDIVIHLAAVVGGIGANRNNPGKFFFENAIMGLLMMEEARQVQIERFVAIGTICAYPKFTPVPFQEEDLWNGYPEETNAPYGLAKKMLLVQSQSYREQYGLNSIYLLPVNLYGPRDNFDLEASHVIPALIRKCLEAKQRGEDHITVWGDGSPTREFLYVEDAAEGIMLAAEHFNGNAPVNLGSGAEIAIKDLIETISRLTGFDGMIKWDTTRPNGQPRRALDTAKAERLFGFKARMPLEQGLKKTIAWYRENRS